MTPFELAGYLIAITGAVLGLIGAYLTSAREREKRHIGFLCWIINSPCLTLSIIGVVFKWWEGLTIVPLIILNFIYWGTAIRGFLNTRRNFDD